MQWQTTKFFMVNSVESFFDVFWWVFLQASFWYNRSKKSKQLNETELTRSGKKQLKQEREKAGAIRTPVVT